MSKEYKDYGYITKAVPLPGGGRKFIRAKSKRELDRKVLEFQLSLAQEQNRVVVENDMTVTELTGLWLDKVKKPVLRPQSYDSYHNCLFYHMLPVIGEMRVCDVRPIHIIDIMNNHGYKTKDSNRRFLVCIRSLFRFAVENDIIAKTPVPARMTVAGTASKEDRPLTPNQTVALLNYCRTLPDPNVYTFTLLALTTGMRRGEIAALRWDCVDFQNGVVSVRRQLISRTEEVTEELKTESSRRDIPIPPYVAEHLHQVRAASTSTYVVAGTHDGHIVHTDIARYERAWNRAGATPTHVHAHLFRKTYATRLVETGTDPKRVQYLLGHAALEMTLRVYAMYDKESQLKATQDLVTKTFNFYDALAT